MLIQGIKDSFACIHTDAIAMYIKSHTIRKRLTKSFLFNTTLGILGLYGPWYVFPVTLIFHIVCMIVTAVWTNDVFKKSIQMYPVKIYNIKPHNFNIQTVSQIPFKILGGIVYKILLLTCIQLTASIVDVITIVPYGVRTTASVLLLSLTYGYIAWDGTLGSADYDLSARFAIIESNTLYFIGFGLPITLASSFWTSFFTNAAVYNLFSIWICMSSVFQSQHIAMFEHRVYIPVLRPYRNLLQKVVPMLTDKIGNCLKRWYARKHDSNSTSRKLS